MDAEDQVVRFAEVGARTVAWSSVGSGPRLVVGGWWSSHLVLDWADESFRGFVQGLGEFRAVVRYDPPGAGASERDGGGPGGFEHQLGVLEGLIDTIGAERVDLLGASSGCAVASAYAARHPDRVDALVLYGGYARGEDIASPAARESMLALVAQHWGLGSRILADVFLPGANAREREEFAQLQRRSATRDAAVAALRQVYAFDSSAHLSEVRVPTLVLHRRGDRAIPFALGRDLAASIPGAEFVALEGADHFPWRGDAEAVVHEIARFLGAERLGVPTQQPAGVQSLTAREREVLSLVARGHTDAQIAETLVLSVHTVHRHIANVRTKLDVPSRTAAAAWALSHGVIPGQ